MRQLAATLSLSIGLTATVPAFAQDRWTPIDPPAPATTAPPTDADPFAAPPVEQAPPPQAVPLPPAQSEPPVPFGQFVSVYEPDRPEHSSKRVLPPADIVLPPRTAGHQPHPAHPADVIDPQARELIRQRELAVARQRTARIQYRKWQGISLLRPTIGDPMHRNRGTSASPVQTIHFRSR